jgi:hypothetical protein
LLALYSIFLFTNPAFHCSCLIHLSVAHVLFVSESDAVPFSTGLYLCVFYCILTIRSRFLAGKFSSTCSFLHCFGFRGEGIGTLPCCLRSFHFAALGLFLGGRCVCVRPSLARGTGIIGSSLSLFGFRRILPPKHSLPRPCHKLLSLIQGMEFALASRFRDFRKLRLFAPALLSESLSQYLLRLYLLLF